MLQFATVMGRFFCDVTAQATATFKDGVIGFKVTPNTGNAGARHPAVQHGHRQRQQLDVFHYRIRRIRIMNDTLTGPMFKKEVIIQPAYVVDDSAVTEPGAGSRYFVIRPVAMSR